MKRKLAHVAVVVRDYDEAIAFYTRVLGFRLVEDTDLGAENVGCWCRRVRRMDVVVLLAQAAK